MRTDYIEGKISTALALADGQCGGSYSDACILLSAMLSGVAAELEIIERVPALEPSVIRRFSYPAKFYDHVRSNLSHQWKLSPKAAGVPMTSFPAGVSYVNRLDNTNMAISRRLIHFHVDWIAEIARSIAANSAPLIEAHKVLSPPGTWWVEGE